MPRIILASTSQYRRQLMERLGCPFDCQAPAVDEERLKDPSLAPVALAEHLAREKAASIHASQPAAIVVGCDQLACCEGRVLGKPGSHSAAVEQLQFLSGRVHELVTAVCVFYLDRQCSHTDITQLKMRALTRNELERYAARDQPYDCAGAYKLEQSGITLFEQIESRDHSAITGMPLIALTTILRELGVNIP